MKLLVLIAAIVSSCLALFNACGISAIPSNRFFTPEEHINLGVAYEHSHDLEAAVKEYKAASREIPIAYLYLGNVFFQRGQFEEAEKAYRKAIDKTNDPGACNNLAWLYYTRDVNLDEAEKLAMEAVNADPANEEFRDTLTRIREKRTIKIIYQGPDNEKR